MIVRVNGVTAFSGSLGRNGYSAMITDVTDGSNTGKAISLTRSSPFSTAFKVSNWITASDVKGFTIYTNFIFNLIV